MVGEFFIAVMKGILGHLCLLTDFFQRKSELSPVSMTEVILKLSSGCTTETVRQCCLFFNDYFLKGQLSGL